MPPESNFRWDTKRRGRARQRLLLQLPPMTALFSTTKPYITHAGPAPLARSWLIHHPRTYDASPLPQKEDHILQLSPQNSKTRLSTLSARYSIHLSDSRPLATVYTVSHLGLLHMLFSGETWDFFTRQLRHCLIDTAFPGPLKGLSPLRHTALFWNLSLSIYPCLLASMIFYNNVGTTRAGLCGVLSPQLTQSFPDRGLLN